MHLGRQAIGDAIDGRQRRGKLPVRIPLAPQTLVVRGLASNQMRITEIGQGRIVDLQNEPCVDDRAI